MGDSSNINEKSLIFCVWQVTNHHVVAKLATDGSGIHCCKVLTLFF